ncbi:Fatty acid synthase subunit alpha, partial [Zancudomyces culisetae]
NTATDKEGRSVPAPGQGILTTARELPSLVKSPLLDINYRQRQLAFARQNISHWVTTELDQLRSEINSNSNSNSDSGSDSEFEFVLPPNLSKEDYLKERTQYINNEAIRMERVAQSQWGMDFYKNDPRISPLRGALAVYNLTVDDIGVASFHGTSTVANDKNESDVFNQQFAHLGRTPGNACPAIFQKYLTGHSKGAAAAWMLNGVTQSILSGIIPGNRNADNIDSAMNKFDYILYPSTSIQTDGIKAGLLKSFGFGQVGGEVLVVHPDHLFASLSESAYSSYCQKVEKRKLSAFRVYHDSLTGVRPYVKVKSSAPYSSEIQSSVYLDPTSRAHYDPISQSYSFSSPSPSRSPSNSNSNSKSTPTQIQIQTQTQSSTFASSLTSPISPSAPSSSSSSPDGIAALLLSSLPKHSTSSSSSSHTGVGMDFELVSALNYDPSSSFISNNFTPAEIAYCSSHPDPASSFTGKWCAKEAVYKAISNFTSSTSNPNSANPWSGITRGPAQPLINIEILNDQFGAPYVTFHNESKNLLSSAGIKNVAVSISHSGSYAGAFALAQ